MSHAANAMVQMHAIHIYELVRYYRSLAVTLVSSRGARVTHNKNVINLNN